MKKLQEEARAALTFAKETMKHIYDKHTHTFVDYQPGDLVWLEGTNLKTDHLNKKLEDKHFGSFPIYSKIGASAYKLKLP